VIAAALALMLSPAVEGPRDVARCIADNDPRGVRALLATLPGSPAELRAGRKLRGLMAACAGRTDAAGDLAWRERAEIAEAALRNHFETGHGRTTGVGSASAWRVSADAKLVAGRDYSSADLGMRMFGECVVAAQSEAAAQLLRTEPGSAEESKAIGALSPALGPCLASGQNLRVKRQDLRFVLAEPLYHFIVG
jgi:hypothetical protein